MTAHPVGPKEPFVQHRRLLFSIAYRITGSAADADELVQEAYLRYLRAGTGGVRDARGFLVTVVTRLAVDRLRLARTQRESYWGTWLPEPIATEEALGPDATAEQRETLTLAFLALLERLTPTERAVFVLREAFDYPYRRIAAVVDLEEANCRQLYRRAATRVRGERRRFRAGPAHARALLDRFIAASVGAGAEPLEALLVTDVMVWGDGGGKASAIRGPLSGRNRAARFIRGLVRLSPPGTGTQVLDLNGVPTMLVVEPRGIIGVYQLTTGEGDLVAAIHAVRNPDKLARLALALGLSIAPARMRPPPVPSRTSTDAVS